MLESLNSSWLKSHGGVSPLIHLQSNQSPMKIALLTLLHSSVHIMIFLYTQAHNLIDQELNFLVFWLVLALTWAVSFNATVKQK
jgi:hypothetical protein